MASHVEQTLDQEVAQKERFNQPMTIISAHMNESAENMLPPAEINSSSSDCMYSTKTLFCNFVVKFLLESPPMPSDMDNLIDLFRSKLNVPEKDIDRFKTTYQPDRAVQSYTKERFVFQDLNEALRSINISYLLRFRLILKDIFAQLNTLMALELDSQTRNVYRGQRMHFIELCNLFHSFKQRAPICISSFFSTSLERETAVGFLFTMSNEERERMMHVPVLFTIHVRKEDASPDLPFADISKLSTIHQEKEILFTPSQIFIIEKFEIIHDKGTFLLFY